MIQCCEAVALRCSILAGTDTTGKGTDVYPDIGIVTKSKVSKQGALSWFGVCTALSLWQQDQGQADREKGYHDDKFVLSQNIVLFIKVCCLEPDGQLGVGFTSFLKISTKDFLSLEHFD